MRRACRILRLLFATLLLLSSLTSDVWAATWTPEALTSHVGTKTGSSYTLGTTITGNIYWMFDVPVSPGQYIRGTMTYTGYSPSTYLVFSDGYASTSITGFWGKPDGVQIPSGHGNCVGIRTYVGLTYAITSISVYSTGAPPGAPTGLRATSVGPTSVGLAWNSVVGAASYRVYRGNVLIASGITATTYTVSGLNTGTQYVFYVSAVNEIGEGPQSSPLTITTESPPAAPIGLQATNVTSTSLTVTWSAVPGASQYEVFQDRTSVGRTSETSYNFYGLKPVSQHVYNVRAISASGLAGDMSRDLWVQTLDLPVTPSPTGVHSRGFIGETGTITWVPGAGTPPGTVYSVYQSGKLLGTTTDTSYALPNYNPNWPYAVSAQAPGWKPSPMISDSPLGGITNLGGFDAFDLLQNSLALIWGVAGLLLLVCTLIFGPRLAAFVRRVLRDRDGDGDDFATSVSSGLSTARVSTVPSVDRLSTGVSSQASVEAVTSPVQTRTRVGNYTDDYEYTDDISTVPRSEYGPKTNAIGHATTPTEHVNADFSGYRLVYEGHGAENYDYDYD